MFVFFLIFCVLLCKKYVRIKIYIYIYIYIYITGLFAELPGQSCHGFNGRALDKVDDMNEIIIIGMDAIEHVHPSIVITVIFS